MRRGLDVQQCGCPCGATAGRWLAGFILYAVLNGRRERAGRIPQPADLPDDTAAEAPATAGPSANGRDGHPPTANGQAPAPADLRP
jgi:hypothetical protein